MTHLPDDLLLNAVDEIAIRQDLTLVAHDVVGLEALQRFAEGLE